MGQKPFKRGRKWSLSISTTIQKETYYRLNNITRVLSSVLVFMFHLNKRSELSLENISSLNKNQVK